MFRLDVKKVRLTVLEREIVTTGSVGAYDVQFTFDSIWDDLSKTAVFKSGECGPQYSVELDYTEEKYTCKIPWEVTTELACGKQLFIGVYGTRGDTLVIPTVWAAAGYIAPGVRMGQSGIPPTPSIFDQYAGEIKKLHNHEYLDNRDKPDQHPIEAISGLDNITNVEIFEMYKKKSLGSMVMSTRRKRGVKRK